MCLKTDNNAYRILIYASKLTNIPTFDCIFCFQSYTKSRSLQSLSAHKQAADLQEMANAKELEPPCLQSESEVLKLLLQFQSVAHYLHESYTMTTSKLSLAASCKNAIIQHILETTFKFFSNYLYLFCNHFTNNQKGKPAILLPSDLLPADCCVPSKPLDSKIQTLFKQTCYIATLLQTEH